jgi:cobalt-zinc-cadmium efflux system protein
MSGCCDQGCSLDRLRERQRGTLQIVLAVNAAMFFVIVAAALYGKSSALLSDSLDNLGDALTYGLSLYAVSRGAAVKAKVALFKGGLIFLAACAVAVQILYKLLVPTMPLFEIMGTFSLLGLAANSLCLFLLWRHRREDVNMSSVWECSRNDIASNLSVFVAAGAVWHTGSGWPDIAVASCLVLLLMRSAVRVIASARAELRRQPNTSCNDPISHHDREKHAHGHSRGHSHAPANFGRAFAVGITLNTIFVVVEIVYGLLAHSLALVADAGHNLSDVLGLFLAWAVTALGRRAPTERHSYGLQRSSVLAALVNAVLLLIAVGAIALEAIQRFTEPASVAAPTVIWVALLGIAVNAGTAMMFMSGRKGDLNIRGAFTHMAADAAISAGVVAGGVVILFTGWLWVDSALSLLLAAIIVYGTWGLLRDALNLALDAVPEGIDAAAVRTYFLGLPSVIDAHHLHIWGLSTTEVALTVHLVLADSRRSSELLRYIHHELRERFHIGHATIQFESADGHECVTKDCT